MDFWNGPAVPKAEYNDTALHANRRDHLLVENEALLLKFIGIV